MQVNGSYPVQQTAYPQQGVQQNNNVATQQNVSPYQKTDSFNTSSAYNSAFSPGMSKFSPFYRPGQTNQANQNTQTVPSSLTTQDTAATIPAKQPLNGPAETNVKEELRAKVADIKEPQKALDLITEYTNAAIKEREMTNDITWGAKYYSMKAVELAQTPNYKTLPPEQKQLVTNQINEYKEKAVANLNEAKKHAILTYNDCLKANLVYNHFFTGKGTMASVVDDASRQVIVGKLDEAWLRWEKGFEKDFQGKKQLAAPASTVVDNTTKEVGEYLRQLDSLLQ